MGFCLKKLIKVAFQVFGLFSRGSGVKSSIIFHFLEMIFHSLVIECDLFNFPSRKCLLC